MYLWETPCKCYNIFNKTVTNIYSSYTHYVIIIVMIETHPLRLIVKH